MNHLVKREGVAIPRAGLGATAILGLAFAFSSPGAFAQSSNIIRNYSTGSCIAINSTASGTAVVQTPCNTTDATLWQAEIVDKEGSGTAGRAFTRYRNVQTGMCLDLQTNMSTDGMPIVQRACSSATTQQWYPGSINNSFGFYSMVNRLTGKCVDAGGTSVVQQWSCNASANNQMWFR